MNENLCKIKHIDVSRSKIKASVLKMKQQRHDISLRRTRKKKSDSQVGYEPTTLRDLVGCSNHLSYWRLCGEQGPICGSRLEPHHAATQPSKAFVNIYTQNI